MLVKFLGFQLTPQSYFTVAEFMAALAKTRTDDTFDQTGRFLFIDDATESDYYLGLIVTVKNQRKFCELKETKGSFKVIVNNVRDKHHLMEFNFFVVNKTTGAGMYQHYWQSCSIGQSMYLLERKYAGYRDAKRAELKKQLIDSGTSDRKAVKQANKTFQGRLVCEQMVRKEKLPALLKELDLIRALEVDFCTFIPDSKSEFNQLSGLVKKRRERFSFIKSTNIIDLRKAIASTLKGIDTDDGRIFGRDAQGIDRILRIQDNPDNFGEFDYDEVADKIHNLDVSNFSESWVVEKLLEACRGNPIIETKRK